MAGTLLLGLLSLLTSSYAEILLSIASSLSLALLLYRHANRRPGIPVNWPIVGHLPALLANLHHIHDWATDVLRSSGCTFQFRGPVLFGMDFLATCDPANVNHIFNVNFSNYPKGGDFSEFFDILGDGIFNSDDEPWRSQRKKAHSLISHPKFRSFVANCSRAKVENGLIPVMSRIAEQEAVVDLQDVFLRLTFDLTCELVFGVDPGCLSAGFPTIPFAKAMDDAMGAIFLRHVLPGAWWKLLRRLRVGEERKLELAWEVIDNFVAENIAKRKESSAAAMDLLTSYIHEPAAAEDQKNLNLNSNSIKFDKFLRDTTVNLMLAGRDTTGSALTWFFWLLSENPEVEKKIIEELLVYLREKKELHIDFPIVFEAEETGKLVYLHAALCESLRLFPPVPFEHKGVLEPDILPSSDEVRPGKKIMFSTYSMARMEGIWGKDCLEFRPERWISEKGRVRHEPAYKFLSFNCGPRTCLGKDIAFTQLKAVVAAMVCNFHVEVVEGHVVEPKVSIILHMKNGLMVRVRKRSHLMKMVNGD